MPLSATILNQMKCCFSKDEHIVYEPMLIECGGNACKKCIDDSNDFFLECNYCKKDHHKNLLKIPNPNVNIIIKTCLNDLNEKLKVTATETIEALNDIEIQGELQTKLDIIEIEIDIKIESIIDELHKYRDEFKKDLDCIKETFKKLVNKNDQTKFQTKLKDLDQNISTVDEFFKKQNIIRDAQSILNIYRSIINEVIFDTSNFKIEKKIIGDFTIPIWCKFMKECPGCERLWERHINFCPNCSNRVHVKKLMDINFCPKCTYMCDVGTIRCPMCDTFLNS